MSEQRERIWVPTADVRIGDQLAHKLSDTPWTYTEVTGWSDKTFSTGTVQRRFTVAGAPWWVRCDDASLWHSLDGHALIRVRPGDPPQYDPPAPAVPAESAPEPVTRVVLSDDYYGYRMPVPSSYTSDLLASDADKWTVLESIGITRRDDTSPLAAWRDAVADESGLDRSELDPSRGGRLDAGFTPTYVRTFIFYLA